MDLSRTKMAVAVYALGLAGPALLVAVLTFLEHAGLHLGVGVGLIALASFGVSVAGVCLQRATIGNKMVFVLVALIVIPVEILALGAICLAIYGLEGTQ